MSSNQKDKAPQRPPKPDQRLPDANETVERDSESSGAADGSSARDS